MVTKTLWAIVCYIKKYKTLMIQITDKTQCCGCSSCAQRCPKGCISMIQDEEGFLYPQVDASTCIDCGLCEKVCPILNPKQAHEPLKVFASNNPDETIRKESSSGGIFSILAESVIREGGVVFGARWNKDWNVVHDFIEPLNHLNPSEALNHLSFFRGSKYVQSNINGSYQKSEVFLKEGRKVLFSGTPCQIAGLKSFLRKEYDNLLTVECACHGVPSPGLWQKYLSEVTNGKSVLSINHRDKRTGWRNYSVVIKFTPSEHSELSKHSELSEPHDNNPWTRAFIKNLTLRPSCHQCAFKTFKSQSDITLADLWGDKVLMLNQNEDKGLTLVIARSPKISELLKSVESIKDFNLQDIVPFNGALVIPPKINPKRLEFMSRLQKGESFTSLVTSMTKAPLILRLKLFVYKLLH